MSKVLIYVSGGNIQWTAGDPDLQITIVDADNESVDTGEPDTCVPEDEEFDDYLDDHTKFEISRYELHGEVDFELRKIYREIGIDTPSNHEQVRKFVYEDVIETSDDQTSQDIRIAFRRFIESE